MIFVNSKKGFLHNISEWFIPALIALVLGFLIAFLMSRGIMPDVLNLF